MKRMTLIKTQRNDVLGALQEEGLDTSEFIWNELEEERIPMVSDEAIISELVHKPTGYSFQFDVRGDHSWGTFSPGPETPRAHECGEDWRGMVRLVQKWALALKGELDAPDLWAAICEQREFLTGATQNADEPMSEPEREELRNGLRQVREYLFAQDAVKGDSEHKRLVEDKLEYLESALGRMSRGDWVHTTIGVLFTIVVGVAMAPGQARELFRLASDVLGQGLKLLGS